MNRNNNYHYSKKKIFFFDDVQSIISNNHHQLYLTEFNLINYQLNDLYIKIIYSD